MRCDAWKVGVAQISVIIGVSLMSCLFMKCIRVILDLRGTEFQLDDFEKYIYICFKENFICQTN